MGQIDQIRVLTQDMPVRQSFNPTVDGVQTTVQLPLFPLAGSVNITGTGTVPSFTTDMELGIVTFGSVPDAQQLQIIYGSVVLSDTSIQSLLDLEVDGADQIRLAAADALEAVANSQALIDKKIRLLDIQTDGPAVAESLRKAADNLRQLVFNDKYQESTFDWAEEVNTLPDWREKVIKDWLRQQ